MFCYSSVKAFGTVVYVQSVIGSQVKFSLVMSKSRVTHLKQLSPPKLELLTAVVGAKLLMYVSEKHAFTQRARHFSLG